MIYLLFGEDTYRSWQKLQRIKRKYTTTSMGDTDLAMLDGATLTADEFERQSRAMPFLAKSRLVIVKNLLKEGKKEVQTAIGEQLAKLPKSTVLFFYESGKPDKRSQLFQTLNQPKQAEEFPLLEGYPLTLQLIALAKEKNLILSPNLALIVNQRNGPDLWRADQELEKLALYARSTDRPLSGADIKALVTPVHALRIFDLTDAFGLRQADTAVSLLSQTEDEESDLGLLAMIAGHYRNLLLIADGLARNQPTNSLAQVLKLHPFVFDKSCSQAKRYTFAELTIIYRYLLELDLAAKQSLVQPRIGLLVLARALTDKPLKLPPLTEENML